MTEDLSSCVGQGTLWCLYMWLYSPILLECEKLHLLLKQSTKSHLKGSGRRSRLAMVGFVLAAGGGEDGEAVGGG